MKKIVIYSMLLMLFISCSKYDTTVSGRIETREVTEITHDAAISGGTITFDTQGTDAHKQIVQKGIIWSVSEDNIQNLSHRVSGREMNNSPFQDNTNGFLCRMTGLTPNTTYYVRAFAQFGKVDEDNYVLGTIHTFTTNSQQVLVRFRKEANDPYMIEMAIDDANDNELVSHYFGAGIGTSQYYEMPSGNHYLWFYDSHPDYNDWHFCLDEPHTFNFQAGRKYTVVCVYKDEDHFLLDFYVDDDGVISKLDVSVDKSSVVHTKSNRLRTADKRENNSGRVNIAN